MGGFPKVLRYDLNKLLTYSALVTIFCKGTVFTMNSRTWATLLTFLFVASAACGCTILVANEDLETLRLTTFNLEPIQELASQINSLVPFVFGLYLSLSLKRWWDIRVNAIGSIFEQLTSV